MDHTSIDFSKSEATLHSAISCKDNIFLSSKEHFFEISGFLARYFDVESFIDKAFFLVTGDLNFFTFLIKYVEGNKKLK